MRFETSFERLISEYDLRSLIKNAGCVITALSGGADSSCLLRLVDDLAKKLGVTHAAAHVNHMIRGDEADRDEAFCREVCEKLGIPLYVLRCDVPAEAKKLGIGLEECARNVRYSFFDEVSEKLTGDKKCAVIATAHNADDNLETVIFNMLRGCGTHGLCGIPPVRDGRYIRPLLYAGGDEIRAWCSENEVAYVVDSTNTDTDYTRNHIRHNIVPEMKKICTDPASTVARMTALIRRDDEYIDSVAGAYLQAGQTAIEKDTLAELDPAIASRIIRTIYHNASDSYDLTETHVRDVLMLVRGESQKASLSLPNGIRMRLEGGQVKFIHASEDELPEYNGDVVFEYPRDGDYFKNELFRVIFSQGEHSPHNTNTDDAENIYKLSIRKSFCSDKIIGALRIRYRIRGDVYRFGKMNRKVKKLFSDRKMSERERRFTPIFTDDAGIVWIPGFPPRDGVESRSACGDLITVTCNLIDL
jgi:tRNA(Ile)-lysidine synthase